MNNIDILVNSKILFTVFTLFVATVGGFIFFRLKVPAGPMLGAMFFSMIISIFCGKCYIPPFMIVASRVIAGTLIGFRITKASLQSLKKILFPMIFFTFFMLILSMISGFIIYSITGIHKATAFFGSAPGGLTDMSLISSEFGADMSTVALLQVARMIACKTIIPFVAKRTENKQLINEDIQCVDSITMDTQENHEDNIPNKMKRFAATIFIGMIGGLLGIALSIPAGALTGAFIFVAITNAFFLKLFIPVKIRFGTQVLIGTVIGSSVTMSDVLGFKNILVPALMVTFFLLAIGILLGFLLNKIWKIDMITALISTAPGGLTSMALIAPDLGADVAFVTSLQFVRLVAIVLVYPIAMRIII
jgi:hypothetical protein